MTTALIYKQLVMKLKCKRCGEICSGEIPKKKEEQMKAEWDELPLCFNCFLIKMRERAKGI